MVWLSVNPFAHPFRQSRQSFPATLGLLPSSWNIVFRRRQIGRLLRKVLLSLFALAIIPVCLACGGDNNSANGTTVDVTLKDFQITSSKSSENAGDVTFKIKNNGPSQHEFVVDRTDLKAADLPYDDSKFAVIEDSPQLTNIDEKQVIKPGDTESLTVNLAPGHYVLFCNIPTHYQQGMRIDFTVN